MIDNPWKTGIGAGLIVGVTAGIGTAIISTISPQIAAYTTAVTAPMIHRMSMMTNQAKGALGEARMMVLARRAGWKIASGFTKAYHGFDGIFRDSQGRLIIAEAKAFGGTLRNGQMSLDWIKNTAQAAFKRGKISQSLLDEINTAIKSGKIQRMLIKTTIEGSNLITNLVNLE